MSILMSFFNVDRISCAHIRLVLTSNSLKEILPVYIINRWEKIARKVPIFGFDSVFADA